MAQRFGLWQRIRKLSSLDPRRDKRRGYSPEVIVGQLVDALCTGGGCLSDSEALNEDPLAGKLFGVDRFADQSQVGEWLRGQSDQSVEDLRKLLREFVEWVWQQADPRRLLHCGQREVFFDDTQLEVRGRHFEGAAINYNGDLALSWQTLWVGPFLADSHIGSPKDVSDQLPSMMDRNRPPCSALIANPVYYLIGALAYDLMTAIKILDLQDQSHGWRVKILMKKLVMLPGRLSQRSRQWVTEVMVPGVWMNSWQRWAARVWPHHERGRPNVVNMAL
jgi:hypothetical protein